MTYRTWKDLTAVRGYPRSSSLKSLDKALLAYENGTGTIQQLLDAFNKWMATKPSQVSTIRNRQIDAQGLGPVQRLWRYINNEKGSFSASQPGVTFDAQTSVYLTDDGDYSNTDRKVVFETIANVKASILAARESFQSGGFLSKPAFDALYRMWFGARNPEREQLVKDLYDRLEEVVCKRPVNVHDAYDAHGEFGHAYRGLNEQANIWLGEGFWALSTSITRQFHKVMDAKVGTVLHEFAHSILDAADERLADGKVCNDTARDRTLANSLPAKAVNNADNIANYALDCGLTKSHMARIP